jgi:pantoate--beta-alanine ligase
MRVVCTVEEVRADVAGARAAGSTIGLVPTMGAFHEGHLSLMRAAREQCGHVVVSLFVNPTQFGPGEDFERYPRDLERDRCLAEEVGVDTLWTPTVRDMYPPGFCTYVQVEGLSETMEGAFRPGHFRGVTTVVAKLFTIVTPDRAYFGQKDYQQLVIVRRMARDLDLPVEIVSLPTVREPDGLAMSSRNSYLSAEDRQAALCLKRALDEAQRLIQSGMKGAREVEAAARALIEAEPRATLDYLQIVHPTSLQPAEQIEPPVVVAGAIRVGGTRLIDNITVWSDSDATLSLPVQTPPSNSDGDGD